MTLSRGITVVLCCYNHAHYLTKQLQRIVSQLDEIYEIILLDDGSTDDSYLIMNEYSKSFDRIILLRNEKNQGLASAVNLACSHIKSNYVYFASADDQVMPNFFKDFNRAINLYPNYGFYFGDFAKSKLDGTIYSRVKHLCHREVTPLSPDDFAYEISKGFRHAPGQTVIFDTSELKRINFFNSKLGGWLDLFPQYIIGFRRGVVYLPGIYSIARITDESWGVVQSRNMDLLRSAGIEFTKMMICEKNLSHLIKKSGLLIYPLSGYRVLFKTKKIFQFIKLHQIIFIFLREAWYLLPNWVRLIFRKLRDKR